MRPQHDPYLTDRARDLRRNLEPAEATLWQHLRGKKLGVRFRRQQPLLGYIVDFVAIKPRLIIELDGGPHESGDEDYQRDERLRRVGYRTFRFWNWEVRLNVDEVVSDIKRGLADPSFVLEPRSHEPW